MNPVCPILNEVYLLQSDISLIFFSLINKVLPGANIIKSCMHHPWHCLLSYKRGGSYKTTFEIQKDHH